MMPGDVVLNPCFPDHMSLEIDVNSTISATLSPGDFSVHIFKPQNKTKSTSRRIELMIANMYSNLVHELTH